MPEVDCQECGSTNISWVEIRWTDFTVMQKKYQDVPYCIDCFDKVAEATPFNKIITDEMQVKEYNMTFDELLTLFDDNKVPYKLIEILTGPK